MRELCIFSWIQPAANFFIPGRSLETDSDFVENCVIPATSFRMQHTWLRSRLRQNLTNGSSVDVNSDVVFNTYQPNADLPPAYRMQIVKDAGNLPFVIRQHFAAFQLSRKEIRPNFEHEQQEKELVYVFWGVDANDLRIRSPSICPEEEETSSYRPGYGPPSGEDCPNSDDQQAVVLVPETPEQSVRTNQALPTTPLPSESSEHTRFPQALRRNRIREASSRISFDEETWDFWLFSKHMINWNFFFICDVSIFIQCFQLVSRIFCPISFLWHKNSKDELLDRNFFDETKISKLQNFPLLLRYTF